MRRAGFLAALPLVAAGAQIVRAQTASLRIGTLLTDTFAEAYYADDMGFFAKAGLTVEIQSFRNAGEISAAVLGGALDLGAGTPISLANAYLRGIPLQYIAAGGLYRSVAPTTGFCVAKDSPLKTAKDFEGKTVSINGFKDPTQLSVIAWLTKNGADPSKVNMVEIPTVETGQAIARGTVAGGVMSEPSLSAAIASGEVRLFAKNFDAIAPSIMIVGWFTTSDWVKQNLAVAKRFVAVIYQTAKWANANQTRSGQILQKYSKISDATLHAMTRATYAESLEPAMINPTLALAAAYKFTDRLVNGSDLIEKL
jgi:NitT/TauT family transport system substrate-binding protein